MSKNSTAAYNVIPFDFGKKQVRAMLINDKPWFVAKDVIIALGYAGSSNPARVVGHVPDEWKGVNPIHTHGGIQRLLMLSEQGLYFFICRSDKEQALPFQKWVAGDVLPTIRKHGRYEDNNNHMATLMDELIGMSELSVIKGLIRDKAKAVPAEKRQSFAMTMHSRLHTRFNVPRTELIPAGQFESACNFIAAYAIEGEWLPKEEQKKSTLTLDQYEVSSLYSFMTHYYHAIQIAGHIGLKGTAKLLESKPLMRMEDHLGEASFGFARLDKRRAEIYEIVRRNCGEGGYAMIADGIKPYRSNEGVAA